MGATAHLDFIAAAYAAAVIIVGALLIWITLDYRAQLRTLAELDRQGVTRRSGARRAERTIEQAKAAANAQAKEEA
jgi:heme exporter protein D